MCSFSFDGGKLRIRLVILKKYRLISAKVDGKKKQQNLARKTHRYSSEHGISSVQQKYNIVIQLEEAIVSLLQEDVEKSRKK